MENKELVMEALKARKQSYSPYSGFAVGAALLCEDGTVFHGCNIENAAFTPTICAERTALFKAVSEGVRCFQAIAIVGSLEGEKNRLVTSPCGVCRQALNEFCEKDMPLILAKSEEEYQIITLGELLPLGFGPKNIQ